MAEVGKLEFGMNDQDVKELSDFYAYESIHTFNDTTHSWVDWF